KIGEFLIRGKYSTDDGKCHWVKQYIGKHDVFYQGYNEGKGIWGTWEIPPEHRGGFYIWPTAMGDPTLPKLTEALSGPVKLNTVQGLEELVVEQLQPVGAESVSYFPDRAQPRRR